MSRLALPCLAVALLLPAPAWAHYPHDGAYWFAVSPDPTVERLVLSLERIDLEVLGRTGNGLDWEARLVGALADGAVNGAAFASTDRLFIATRGRGLLQSEDAGDQLVPVTTVTDLEIERVVASPAVMSDGVIFAVGESRTWRSNDAGLTWSAVLEAQDRRFTELALSPEFATDGRACVAEGERLSCTGDGGDTWTAFDAPGMPRHLSVGSDGRVWVATRETGLSVTVDEGQTWNRRPQVGSDVAVVSELAGDLVLVAEPSAAGWRSPDGGDTWNFVYIEEIGNAQGGDVEFLDFVQGPRHEIYMATWNGLARSDDGGFHFRYYATERPENAHTLSLLEGGDGSVLAWIGTYGSGPILTDIRTHESADFPSLPVAFTRTALAADGFADNGIAIQDEGYSTWRTENGGDSWTAIAEDPLDSGEFSTVEDIKGIAMAPDPTADPFLVTVIGSDVMSFRVSDDLGDTWVDGTTDPECTGQSFAVAISPRWHERPRAYGACDGDLYQTDDRGRTWQRVGQTGTSFVFRIAERTDGVVLLATSAGLWAVDESGTRLVGFEEELVSSVATAETAGDLTVFATVPTCGWYRSDDGGEHWSELERPTADVPRMVDLSPDYARDGVVAVGGYYGSWASRDRGVTWAPIHALDVYEEDSDAWRIEGNWRAEPTGEASRGKLSTSGLVGAAREIDFEGISASLEIPTSAALGAITVRLDGGPPQLVELPADTLTAWHVLDLAEGWHTLRVEVAAGTATIDTLRVVRIPERAAREVAAGEPPVESEEQCGCGSGAGGVIVLLGLVRRRRPTAPAPSRG